VSIGGVEYINWKRPAPTCWQIESESALRRESFLPPETAWIPRAILEKWIFPLQTSGRVRRVNEHHSRPVPYLTLNGLNKFFQFLGIKPITFRKLQIPKLFREMFFLGANKLRSQTHDGERYQHYNQSHFDLGPPSRQWDCIDFEGFTILAEPPLTSILNPTGTCAIILKVFDVFKSTNAHVF
jgi:hypothetical protein